MIVCSRVARSAGVGRLRLQPLVPCCCLWLLVLLLLCHCCCCCCYCCVLRLLRLLVSARFTLRTMLLAVPGW